MYNFILGILCVLVGKNYDSFILFSLGALNLLSCLIPIIKLAFLFFAAAHSYQSPESTTSIHRIILQILNCCIALIVFSVIVAQNHLDIDHIIFIYCYIGSGTCLSTLFLCTVLQEHNHRIVPTNLSQIQYSYQCDWCNEGQASNNNECSKCICSICLDSMNVCQVVTLHCNHSYHAECFSSYIANIQQHNVRCCLCRQSIV